jgi:hypothetical protein
MKFRISHSTVGDVSHIPHVLIFATPVYYVCSGRSLENYGVVHKGKLIDYLEGQAIFAATRKSVRSRDQWWYSLVHFEIHLRKEATWVAVFISIMPRDNATHHFIVQPQSTSQVGPRHPPTCDYR